MIAVDSSVWIDYLNDVTTRQTSALDRLLDEERVAVLDLVLVEVLQGTRDERAFQLTLARMSLGARIVTSDHAIAVQAARHYRLLRTKGITVRKTIDVLIATRCIADDMALLYRDRDFEPLVEHLGLRCALTDIGLN